MGLESWGSGTKSNRSTLSDRSINGYSHSTSRPRAKETTISGYEAFRFSGDEEVVPCSVSRSRLVTTCRGISHDFRAMATRVINDKKFRTSLVSDDPELPLDVEKALEFSGGLRSF